MDVSSGGRGDGARRPTDRLVVATTDPAITAEADHQSDWMRHPFATIWVETAPAGGPELRPLATPWTIEPPAPEVVPAPIIEPPTPIADAPRPMIRPVFPTIQSASRPWWPIVLAGFLGGVVGSVGYLRLADGPRSRDGHAIR